MSKACTAVLAEVQETIVRVLENLARDGESISTLLDVGCWDGEATVRYAGVLGCKAHGIEIFPSEAAQAQRRGIVVAQVDLEEDPFPWDAGAMDIVVANQVFEHLKNIWLPMSE